MNQPTQAIALLLASIALGASGGCGASPIGAADQRADSLVQLVKTTHLAGAQTWPPGTTFISYVVTHGVKAGSDIEFREGSLTVGKPAATYFIAAGGRHTPDADMVQESVGADGSVTYRYRRFTYVEADHAWVEGDNHEGKSLAGPSPTTTPAGHHRAAKPSSAP